MNPRFCSSLLLALLAALTLFGVDAQVVAPRFAGSSLTAPRHDWPTNGGDWYNQRYSPLTQINRGNVAKLKGVWRTRLRGSGVGPQYSGEAQPLVYDGVDLRRHRRQRRVRRRRRQRRDPVDVRGRTSTQRSRPSAAAGRAAASRIGDGKVFVGPARRQARRARSDARARSSGRSRPSAGRTASRSRARRSTTTASSSPASRAPSSASAAASRRTTRRTARSCGRSTRFPAPASSATTRGRKTTRSGSTAARTVWQTPAVDPELGLIYFSTGNPGPDYNGGVRTRRQPVLGVDRRRRRARPANTAGTSSRCITTSGTTTRRIPSCCSTSTIDGALRKGLAQAEQDRLGLHSRPRRPASR